MAIDAQLDQLASPDTEERKLEHVASKIVYWQKRAKDAAHYHRLRRRRDLRARGVDFRRVKRCPPWPILVQLDLAVDPVHPPFNSELSL